MTDLERALRERDQAIENQDRYYSRLKLLLEGVEALQRDPTTTSEDVGWLLIHDEQERQRTPKTLLDRTSITEEELHCLKDVVNRGLRDLRGRGSFRYKYCQTALRAWEKLLVGHTEISGE